MKRSKKEWMVNRELKRITESIPKELIEGLMKMETVAPTLEKILTKAIELPDGEMGMNEEKRQRFKNMLAAGILSREVQTIDRDKEKLIEEWFEAEIAFAVKMGRLPKEAPIPDFIRKKGKKYAKRQAERIRDIYETNAETPQAGDGGDAGDHPEADSKGGGDAPLLPGDGPDDRGSEGSRELQPAGG